MKDTTKRSILRWVHIVFGLMLAAYIYGPPAQTVQYLPFFRYFYLPMVVLSGFWLWKGATIRRRLSKGSEDRHP